MSVPQTPLSLFENSRFFVQSGAFYRALPLLSLVAVARAVNVDPRHQSGGSGRPKWVTAGPGGGCPPIGAEAGREAGLHPVSPFWENSLLGSSLGSRRSSLESHLNTGIAEWLLLPF